MVTSEKDVGKPKIVWTTGPGAIKSGFEEFSRIYGKKAQAGLYVGKSGQSVKVVGTSANQSEWVRRSVWLDKEKSEIMRRSNMTHLTKFGMREINTTCLDVMYELDHGWGFSEPNPSYW